MLYYGNIQNLIANQDCLVYNFSSYNESFPRLNLYPPKELGYVYDLEFDMNYANYIIYNNNVFIDFMTIIYNLYLGKDVFILVDDSLELLNESLIKLIQQRYGYNANRINCYDDFMEAEESRFSDYGLFNLDQDKERLSYLIQREDLKRKGVI